MKTLFGHISKKDFLQNYWEKKPLLIKNAIKEIDTFATIDDLKELSFDPDFESRIVYNDPKNVNVKHGPLDKSDFEKNHWTLVCHNLNLLDENFAHLENALNFLPHWLFDDVMATYSQKDSTIGAHIDKYNVFIVQAQGKRKWQLQLDPDPTYHEDLEIKILKNFNPDIEWTLEPGDMIYIPSNTAHCGTSLTESISYSLGFKSLETQTIIKNYLTEALINIETQDYLKDQTTKVVDDPYLVKKEIPDYFYKKLQELVCDKDQFYYWMNSYLSRPKNEIETGEVYLEEEIISLAKDNYILKDNQTKIASYKDEDSMAIGINGVLYRLDNQDYDEVKKWFSTLAFTPIQINFDQLNQQTWPLLIDLFKNGTLFFEPKD